jgi:hypothetical protein
MSDQKRIDPKAMISKIERMVDQAHSGVVYISQEAYDAVFKRPEAIRVILDACSEKERKPDLNKMWTKGKSTEIKVDPKLVGDAVRC